MRSNIIIPDGFTNIKVKNLDPKSNSSIKKQSKTKTFGIELPNKNKSIQTSNSLKNKSPQISSDEYTSEPEIPKNLVTLPTINQFERMTKLEIDNLLKAQETKSDSQLVREHYTELAKNYLNRMILHIGGEKYELIEIEFYQFPDPYCGLDSFFPNGYDHWTTCYHHFYLHRIYDRKHETTKLSKGDKRGLYITIGNLKFPGVVLIRSICKGEEIIEGPNQVLDFILNKLSMNIKQFDLYLRSESNKKLGVVEILSLDLACKSPKSLIYTSHIQDTDKKIYGSPRLGLNPLNYKEIFNIACKWHSRVLRFSTKPALLKHGLVLFAIQAMIDEIPHGNIKKELNIMDGLLGTWRNIYLKAEYLSPEEVLLKYISNQKGGTSQIKLFSVFVKCMD
jgi:hypothetical protein